MQNSKDTGHSKKKYNASMVLFPQQMGDQFCNVLIVAEE